MKKLSFSVLMLFALSCESPSSMDPGTPKSKQEANESSLKVVNGTFSFETVDEFETTVKKIGSMSSQEYSLWQKSHDVKTLYSEYLSLPPDASLQQVAETRPHLITFNEKTNAYELNSVNSNYAKVTNEKGLVIINNATYQFSSTEVKCIKGIDQNAASTLLTSKREEYEANSIKFSSVEEGFKPGRNAKVGPWEKEQRGNAIRDMKGWDGDYYLKSWLVCRYYWIPNPWFPGMDRGMMAIEVSGKYYREKGWGPDEERTPQQYSTTWSFELSDGLANFGTYYPYSGTWTESGIPSFAKVLYDGIPCDIRNLNIPVTAMDFNKNGNSVTSTTTFVVTN